MIDYYHNFFCQRVSFSFNIVLVGKKGKEMQINNKAHKLIIKAKVIIFNNVSVNLCL